mgnify:CR=1 FL=1
MSIPGQQVINVGLPNEPTNSDSLYTAFTKANVNFTTLFNSASPYNTFTASAGIGVTSNANTGTVTVTNTGVTNIIAGTNIVIDQANGNVTISSGISDVTYREMLYQFMNNPYSVGLTYIQSATANQVLETLSVNTKDANGNLAQKTLVPTIDPYQQQTNIVAMKYAYRIDGFTKIIIAQVLANATLSLYFYPADNINLARALGGQPVSRQFGTPPVTNGQTIKLRA